MDIENQSVSNFETTAKTLLTTQIETENDRRGYLSHDNNLGANNRFDQRSLIDNQEERLKELEGLEIEELFEPITKQKNFMRFKFQKKKYKLTPYGLEQEMDDSQEYLEKLKLKTVMSNMSKVVTDEQVKQFKETQSKDNIDPKLLLKAKYSNFNAEVRINIIEFPYQGISDLESSLNLISILQFKNLIVSNGDSTDSQNFLRRLKEENSESKVFFELHKSQPTLQLELLNEFYQLSESIQKEQLNNFQKIEGVIEIKVSKIVPDRVNLSLEQIKKIEGCYDNTGERKGIVQLSKFLLKNRVPFRFSNRTVFIQDKIKITQEIGQNYYLEGDAGELLNTVNNLLTQFLQSNN